MSNKNELVWTQRNLNNTQKCEINKMSQRISFKFNSTTVLQSIDDQDVCHDVQTLECKQGGKNETNFLPTIQFSLGLYTTIMIQIQHSSTVLQTVPEPSRECLAPACTFYILLFFNALRIAPWGRKSPQNNGYIAPQAPLLRIARFFLLNVQKIILNISAASE